MKNIITLLLLIFSFQILSAQPGCPSVSISPANINMCGGCTTLTATVQGTVTTTLYSVNSIPYTPFSFSSGTPILIGIDDEWSDIINLPFCFEFFGSTYTQCIVGSNGCIGFDLINANGYNTWPIGDSIPSAFPPDMLNSIMGPWHDIDPGVGGSQYYELQGAAPCRRLVVSWFEVPMFSSICNPQLATHQIVLYETTNIIEVYIQDKPLCPTWNSGAAIEGIQNATGTQAYVVPGRNYPVQWTATNDAWRFTPAGAPQYTLTWYEGTTPIGTNLTVNVCPTTTTIYTAELVNNTCNGPVTVTAQATVTVAPAFSLNVSSTPSACAGNNGSATVNVTSGGNPPFSYSWNTTPVQTTSTATGLPPGNYTVTVTDSSGCIATDTVVVSGSIGPSASISTSANVLCSGGNTGSATVTATGGTLPYTYVWSPTGGNAATASNLSAGNYTVAVTDSNGCTDTVTITITEPTVILLTASSIQATCGQANGSAAVTASGGTPPYNYSWSTTPVQTTSNATNIPAGNYTVTVTDANGCTSTATVTVTEPPGVSVTTSSVEAICGQANGSATVSASGGTSPYSYAWSSGGSAATENNLSPGSYTVTVTDVNGCTATALVSVSNVSTITVSFTASPQTTTIEQPLITFTDNSTGATSWQWDFGDGSAGSNSANPTHTYTNPGNYNVCLTATDQSGCTDVTCILVHIEEGPFAVYIPNVFTPNHDGANDIFTAAGTGITAFELIVYDRWGIDIFKTTDIQTGWNGILATGERAMMDVYVYFIRATDPQGVNHTYVGSLSLIR